MRPDSWTRRPLLLLTVVLTLALTACDGDQDAQEDPRGALRDALMAFRDYEGVELVFGAQLDEEAQVSARTEGELTEEELRLLTGSTLTVRGVEGEGDEDGQTELLLVVGDEEVASLRSLGDYEVYALIDLPAIERVADSLDASDGFRRGIGELEQFAGLLGLSEVVAAAREAEWVRLAGLQDLAEMDGDGAEQPDPADLDQLGRQVGERLIGFVEDEDVAVTHVDDEDAGQRVRLTATGTQLRDLLADVLAAVDDVADVADPTGMGMAPAEIREQLEQQIPDDVEISLDAWIDGGELSQVAVDVFEIARATEQDDVPDGQFLIAIGISEFGGPVDAPDAVTTFDVMDAFGGMMGDLGGLDADASDEDPAEDPAEEAGEAPEELVPPEDDDFCFTREEIDELLEQFPEEEQDLSDEELEELLGLPIC
jgi:hypothetical protein